MRTAWQQRRARRASPALWGRLLASVCLVAYVHLLSFHIASADHHSEVDHAGIHLQAIEESGHANGHHSHGHGGQDHEDHAPHSIGDHSLELMPHKESIDLGITDIGFSFSPLTPKPAAKSSSVYEFPVESPLTHLPERCHGARAPPQA